MCQFTRIIWHSCGHRKLSTEPERTLLCETARIHNFRPGIENAAPRCHPLPEDLLSPRDANPQDQSIVRRPNANPKIFHEDHVLAFCDDCKRDSNVAPGIQKIPLPIIPPAEELYTYSDEDIENLGDLRVYLENIARDCGVAMNAFNTALLNSPLAMHTALLAIRTPQIRIQLLAHAPAERYHFLFFQPVAEAQHLHNTLGEFLNMRMPQPLFTQLYENVRNRLDRINARRVDFVELLDCLQHNAASPGDYTEAINRWTDRMARSLGYIAVPGGGRNAPWSEVERPEKYHPRRSDDYELPSFTAAAGRNRNGLFVNTEVAQNPPSGTQDIPQVPDVELEREKGLPSPPMVLRPLGTENRSGGEEEGMQDGSGGVERQIAAALRYVAAEKHEETPQVVKGEGHGRTVAANATFMGLELSDLDSDVSEEGETGRADVSVGNDTSSLSSVPSTSLSSVPSSSRSSVRRTGEELERESSPKRRRVLEDVVEASEEIESAEAGAIGTGSQSPVQSIEEDTEREVSPPKDRRFSKRLRNKTVQVK